MIDSFGLVVQDNGDGGDAPCRAGVVISYWAAQNHAPSQNNFIQATQKYLMVKPNIYVRYPFTPSYNIPGDFSRDQASRLMLGYGMAGRADLVNGYYGLLWKNGCKHPNGDYIGTGEPLAIIRALGLWYLWPLLWLLDIKFLYDVLIGIRIQPFDYDNLFVADLWYAKNKFWTPFAWLASKLYNRANALARIANNLLTSPTTNGCKEAYVADCWFVNNL